MGTPFSCGTARVQERSADTEDQGTTDELIESIRLFRKRSAAEGVISREGGVVSLR
jgi:hypothetical protein